MTPDHDSERSADEAARRDFARATLEGVANNTPAMLASLVERLAEAEADREALLAALVGQVRVNSMTRALWSTRDTVIGWHWTREEANAAALKHYRALFSDMKGADHAPK